MRQFFIVPGVTCTSRARILMLLLAGLFASAACGQPPDDAKAKTAAKNLQKLRDTLQGMAVYQITDKGRSKAELAPRPLMRFTDRVDNIPNAGVWMWGTVGRPVAMAQTWGDPVTGRWMCALVSVSTGLVQSSPPGGTRWAPQSPGVKFQRFPNAPPPATDKRGRLRQMKELARRFKTHENVFDKQRFELRMLVQPVHRYEDPKAGVLDAAVFLSCRGSDPEIILLIELAKDESSKSAYWQFTFAPISSGELHATLGEKEVWVQPFPPNVGGHPTAPYWIVSIRLSGR